MPRRRHGTGTPHIFHAPTRHGACSTHAVRVGTQNCHMFFRYISARHVSYSKNLARRPCYTGPVLKIDISALGCSHITIVYLMNGKPGGGTWVNVKPARQLDIN